MHERRAIQHGSLLVARTGALKRQDIARRGGTVGDGVLDLKGSGRALGAVASILGRRDAPRRNVHVEKRALEDAKGGLGLVGGDLVAGLVHAAEREVAVLADLAPDVRRIDVDVGVASGAKGRGGGVVDGEGDGLAAEPVAGVVAVAVHQADLDAGVEQVGEVGEVAAADVAARVVADGGEGVVDAVDGFGVVDGHAERALHPVLGEEAEEVRGREGVRVDGGDVVVVAPGFDHVRALDVVGAVAVGVLARVVDGDVVADEVGVAHGGEVVAVVDAVTAAAGLVECVEGALVGALVDGLDVVGVIVGHRGVIRFLGEEVDATVDDAEGVEVDVVVITCRVERSVGDPFVLFFEESGERWAITTSILETISISFVNIYSRQRFRLTDSVQMLILSSLGL